MNNIRKIITERLENAKLDYQSIAFTRASGKTLLIAQINAYQDCLNLIEQNFNNSQLGIMSSQELSYYANTPAPRTEQEILNDFEKLGWKVTQNDDSCMIICFNGFARIVILKCAKRYSINNLCNMQEHKLLNELFEVIFNE